MRRRSAARQRLLAAPSPANLQRPPLLSRCRGTGPASRDNSRDNIHCVHYVHEPARFGRSGRPWKHLHARFKVEGLVDRMVRGSSSLLGRTGKTPRRGFSLPDTAAAGRPTLELDAHSAVSRGSTPTACARPGGAPTEGAEPAHATSAKRSGSVAAGAVLLAQRSLRSSRRTRARSSASVGGRAA